VVLRWNTGTTLPFTNIPSRYRGYAEGHFTLTFQHDLVLSKCKRFQSSSSKFHSFVALHVFVSTTYFQSTLFRVVPNAMGVFPPPLSYSRNILSLAVV